ncbi:hypothetical protein GSI_04730 [Ganoderma sinense ZZ0214-1]|uniref:Fe2OG dioxygenase domain-containing protein n=1 Tax=Ganoderma sinense ZZ0214-1 TaxID=1077348 RepID=A0A2G8SHP2_9APHY|nr:hypothetical protein GSI_04730 [Ganoderma sinense ZZ0214-1]
MDACPEFPLLQRLKTTLTMSLPYCSGILEVPPEALKLYYGGQDARCVHPVVASLRLPSLSSKPSHRFIDLQETATSNDPSGLEALANACEQARFGRGEETVLDETYRKAGKMDTDDFMTGLDIEATGLRDAVQLGLLSDKDEKRGVRAELYKLNVYGEGAFFKPHKDTPRSQSMFGSLVVVFPTPHAGGALVLRHNDDQFTFDAAALLSGRTSSIAYVAFFSDVEHEVAPVLSGHRVTLTYNLYYGTRRNIPAPARGLEVFQPPHASASTVKAALAALLDAPTFLPRGGTLGFGLRHAYPIPKVWTHGMESPLKSLGAWLKGSDAALFAACTALGVKPHLRLVCRDYEPGCESEIVLNQMLELGDCIESPEAALLSDGGRRVTDSYTFTGDAQKPWESVLYRDSFGLTVHWVTKASAKDGPRSAYVAYGNEASLDWLYTGVCLLVDVEPYVYRSGERGAWRV